MTALLSQAAQLLDLKWTANDPVSLAFTVENADWSGTYLAQIRSGKSRASSLVAALVAVAVYVAPNTNFTLTLTDSTGIDPTTPDRALFWDLQLVGGVTRLTGRVYVDAEVSG